MRNTFYELPKTFLENPIAHRGFHDCNGLKKNGNGPENSRESINAASALGFGIEIDVRLSKDYVPIVFHDHNLLRLCDLDINVSDSRSTVLLNARLKNSEPLPSLEEILYLVNGKVPLLIEIKPRAREQDVGLITRSICVLIENYTGPLALMSFDWSLIIALKFHKPNVPRGLVSQFFEKSTGLLSSDHEKLGISELSLLSHGASFISHSCANLSEELYVRNFEQNRKLLTWTVHSQEMADRVSQKCDNITFEGFVPGNY